MSHHTTPFSQIPTAPLHWLWRPYIPLGKLTLLAGDPASGKTSLALHLAAALSTAQRLPDLTNFTNTPIEPMATLLLSPDDNAADTLRPRLESLSANLDLIHTLPDLPSLLPPKPHPLDDPSTPTPLQQLDAACASIPNLALLIIDPITHYLGLTDRSLPPQHSAISPQHSSSSYLHALSRLAHKHHIALLLTTRLTKSLHIHNPLTPAALHRPLGSCAFTTTPRSVLLLTPFPPATNFTASTNTPIEPNRLLLPLKSNLTSPPPPLPLTIAGQITFHPHLTQDHTPQAAPAPTDLVLQSAVDWLRTALANGPVHSIPLIHAARDNAIAYTTLNRAKSLLAVVSRRHPHNAKWFWSLPGDDTPLPRDPLAEALSHFGETMRNNDENLDLYEKQRQKVPEILKTHEKQRKFSHKNHPTP